MTARSQLLSLPLPLQNVLPPEPTDATPMESCSEGFEIIDEGDEEDYEELGDKLGDIIDRSSSLIPNPRAPAPSVQVNSRNVTMSTVIRENTKEIMHLLNKLPESHPIREANEVITAKATIIDVKQGPSRSMSRSTKDSGSSITNEKAPSGDTTHSLDKNEATPTITESLSLD